MSKTETQIIGKLRLPPFAMRLLGDHRIRFLFVGGFNTLVGYIVFALFLFLFTHLLEPRFGPGVIAEIAYLTTHVVTVLMAFFLYRRFVFRVSGHVLRDLVRFESVYVVSLAINAITLPILVGVMHVHALIAQAVLTLIIATISYFGHRHFSFRRTKRHVEILETGEIELVREEEERA